MWLGSLAIGCVGVGVCRIRILQCGPVIISGRPITRYSLCAIDNLVWQQIC